jgi:hypothetical protein
MRVTPRRDGAAIHRDGFAEHVAVADLEARRLALVFLVLRRIAEGGELKILLPAPMRVGPLMTACGPIQVPGADARRRADDAERPDLDVRRDLRLRRRPPRANRSSRLSLWGLRRLGLGRHHDLGGRHFLAVDLGEAVELPDSLEGALQRAPSA